MGDDNMKTKLFDKSIKLEKITFIFDVIAIAIYTFLFLWFFKLVNLPLTITGTIDLANLDQAFIYQTIFGEITTAKLNSIISLFVLLLIVTIPILAVNIKKVKNITIYDVDNLSVFTKFTQALISLLAFNPFSAVLRFYNTFVLMRLIKGYGLKGFLKSIGPWAKHLFEKKEKIEVIEEDDDEETIQLKKNIRKQDIVYVIRTTLTYIFLVVVAALIIVPFYWMIVTSLKSFYDSSVNPNPALLVLPSQMQWVNYKAVLKELNFGVYISNTIYVAIISTVGTVVTTILAAYAFAKIEFKGREALFSLLIMTMMIPGELYIITNFITVSRNGFGWVGMGEGNNNYFLAMMIPFMTSISYIFFLRQNFKQIPESLYKAARVDGCSDFKYLTRVMIPIASPIIFTITILNFIGSWNAFIWPLSLIHI